MTTPASNIELTTTQDAETSDAPPTRAWGRRIAIFLIVVPVILLSASWFICETWNYFWGNVHVPSWEIIPPALTLTFIASMFVGMRYSNPLQRFAYRVSATWLGVLNFGFFAACAAWIIAGATELLSLPVEPKFLAVAFAGSAILASIYGVVNASWLRITRVPVKLAGLPPAWRGRSVALVTDMHLGNVRGTGFTRRVVENLQKLQPDAVFISGDMFDGVKADLDALLEPWKMITPPGGIYYVSGNHEEFDDRSKFLEAVARTGIRVLNNEKVEVDGLQIVGIHDGETDEPHLYKSLLQRAKIDHARASILLAHQPVHLAIPEGEGISLQLSGHTHGGQIWPWHWLAARVHGVFVHGLHPFGRMQVYTSYGAGTWGVPMRVATKSEIVLIRLEEENP